MLAEEFATDGFRVSLVKQFKVIDENIHGWTTLEEGLFLANEILNLKADGPLVECGTYCGRMTARLSLLCRHTNRDLFAFDSFEGLPDAPKEVHSLHPSFLQTPQGSSVSPTWQFIPGSYACAQEVVHHYVKTFGDISRVTLVKGWLKDTLPHYQIQPAFVFIDVDLVESARDCLRHLWPQLKGPRFYTHEAFNMTHMDAITNPNWWRREMKQEAPKCAGKYYGLSPLLQGIAYLEKGILNDKNKI